MKTYPLLIIGLFILICTSLFFNYPGFATFAIFSSFLNDQLSSTHPTKYLFSALGEVIFRYNLGQSALFTLIIQLFPLNKEATFFYHQNAWIVSKIVIFLSYFLTFGSILYLLRSLRLPGKLDGTHLALVYFLSVTLILSNLALGFFDLLVAPLFILSLSFLLRKKFFPTALFYIISIIFNWTLLIFSPLFLTFPLLGKPLPKIRGIFNLLLIISFGLVVYVNSSVLEQTFFAHKSSQILNIPWLLNHSLNFLQKYYTLTPTQLFFALFPSILSGSVLLVLFAYFTRSILQPLFGTRKTVIFSLIWFILSIILAIKLNPSASLTLTFAAIYFLIYTHFKKLKSLNIEIFLNFVCILYTFFLLFSPFVSTGNLGWLVIFQLLIFSLTPNPDNKIRLILTNVLTFSILFLSYGTNGVGPDIRASYLEIFKLFFASIFIVSVVWQFPRFLKASHFQKILLALVIILLNLSLLPSQGTSDIGVFEALNRVAILHSNPFYNHTLTDNQYPPLSTVIYTAFTHLYQNTIGFNDTRPDVVGQFALATKISTTVFYLLSIILIFFFWKVFRKNDNFKNSDLLIILLTTFSLGLQSNSLTSTDILTTPAMVLAILCLFKKKYFLAGVLLGISASIKWQPVVLFPLFGLTVFNLRAKFSQSLMPSIKVVLGLMLIPVIVWSLVLSQPNGQVSFEIGVIKFLLESPPLLSGLAMNLNWIVTYLLHLTQPQSFGALELSGWMNWQTGSYAAPKIFQGYLFYLASGIILLKYWLSPKKDLPLFLTTAVVIYFSHYMLNRGAYQNHSFYFVLMMLLLYLISPTSKNKFILIIFDIMNFMGQVFFYGTTGTNSAFNRLFLKVDLTVIFAAYYLFIYGIVMKDYFKFKGLLSPVLKSYTKIPPVNKQTIAYLLVIAAIPLIGLKLDLLKMNQKSFTSSPNQFSFTYMTDNLIAGINMNNYEQMSRDFNPQLRSKINRERFEIIRDGNYTKVGPLLNLGEPVIVEGQDWTKLKYSARFSKDNQGVIEVTFIKDALGKYKISDLEIDAPKLH